MESLNNNEMLTMSYYSPPIRSVCEKGTKSAHKKLCDISRNILVIICEYLTFFEILRLT